MGVRHDEQIIELQKRMSSSEKIFEQIRGELREIREVLLGRPTWLVSIVLTLLTSAVLALAVFVITHR